MTIRDLTFNASIAQKKSFKKSENPKSMVILLFKFSSVF